MKTPQVVPVITHYNPGQHVVYAPPMGIGWHGVVVRVHDAWYIVHDDQGDSHWVRRDSPLLQKARD